MKTTKTLLSILTISLFLMNQAHALGCPLECNSGAQAKKSRNNHNHGCCSKAKGFSMPREGSGKSHGHDCNPVICALSLHNSQLMPIGEVLSKGSIKKEPARAFFPIAHPWLKYKTVNFSPHLLSYNHIAPITPSAPLYIFIKRLLI